MFQDTSEGCSGFPNPGKFKLAEDLAHQIPPKVICNNEEMRTTVVVSYSSLDPKFLLSGSGFVPPF